MVMAKGVEDCAFYRHNQLGTLTEVGGDPSEFSIDVAEFHRRQRRRLQDHPRSMTTLTTHDTKRSEDARARISVLAEISDEWAETFARLRQLSPPPDGPLAELIWQAAIGAWPLSRDRLSAYALKAAREAGTSTSWTTPDPRFEQAVQEMVDDAYDHPDVVEELESHRRSRPPPRMVELAGRQADPAHRPRRPRRVPGHRGLGHLAGRP